MVSGGGRAAQGRGPRGRDARGLPTAFLLPAPQAGPPPARTTWNSVLPASDHAVGSVPGRPLPLSLRKGHLPASALVWQPQSSPETRTRVHVVRWGPEGTAVRGGWWPPSPRLQEAKQRPGGRRGRGGPVALLRPAAGGTSLILLWVLSGGKTGPADQPAGCGGGGRASWWLHRAGGSESTVTCGLATVRCLCGQFLHPPGTWEGSSLGHGERGGHRSPSFVGAACGLVGRGGH